MKGIHIIALNSVDSTNSVAASEIIKGTQIPFVVTAAFQTNGRGRQGRGWHSDKDKNVLFSLVIAPEFLKASKQFALNKAFAVAICTSLQKYTDVKLSIKWPNDIYAGNLKIAGILIDYNVVGDFLSHAILGAGINVNQPSFPKSIPNPVSLAQITGLEHNTDDLMQLIISSFLSHYKCLYEGNTTEFDTAYLNLLWRRDTFAPFLLNGSEVILKIIGTDCFGRLLLTDESGNRHCYAMNDIAYVIE